MPAEEDEEAVAAVAVAVVLKVDQAIEKLTASVQVGMIEVDLWT